MAVLLQVARVSLLLLNLYLWNFNGSAVAYVGFVAFLTLRKVFWRAIKPDLKAIMAGQLTTSVACRTGIFLFVLGQFFFRCIYVLASTLEWRSVMLLVYPLLLRLSAHYMISSPREDPALLRELLRASNYKFGPVVNIVAKLLRIALFDFLEASYYCAFVPVLLVSAERYLVDWVQSLVLCVLCSLEAGTMAVLELYHVHGYSLYLHSRRLGAWRKVAATGAETWQTGKAFSRGAIVRHRKRCYKALDRSNIADPSDTMAYYFWQMFRRPDWSLSVMEIQQMLSILVQIVPLILCQHWLLISIWGVSLLTSFMVLGYSVILRRQACRYRSRDEQSWQHTRRKGQPNRS
ncbi:uncharacterized protein MONBRDRAFT_29004 [Monosiga brevicollis MX1]|uniref:Uncharacterized protein n=1 Tax=Monosiga brevicollis TaxID=81824 RepID=A9V9U0_MONBE|nr:uncharacterized protein MONBRDRAFT_29004 [Monosiga brevicollis MX1]EDQ85724.1 predicted protein [Monosiga brevicollis MX1]|eukprot:XP_001749439.1 hypothetical protein [Monosiga brevicollis MX1]